MDANNYMDKHRFAHKGEGNIKMKKLLNDPNQLVSDFLDGFTAVHTSQLKRLPNSNVVVRKQPKTDKVGVISGGGSGHEPAHAGYVGYGMLDAAVCGEVFTSPGADQFLAAIEAANQGKGVLLVIKNYNGDRMNAEMAMEMAEAQGIQTEMVVVNDDVAVADPAQRRGIAGTVLVHKIAGACAETGASLTKVKEVAEKAISRIRSMSVALTPCSLPGVDQPSFALAEDEMEVGIGIHGERGMYREKVASSQEIAKLLVSKVAAELPGSDPLAVLINGMGSTPLVEQYSFARDVLAELDKQSYKIHSTYVGDYMTSLDMAGISLTLFVVDEELAPYLQAEARTVQWQS
jgi:phosphoenolpyruvate---glycerone phosphotransferase subunit DhaK